MFSKHHARAMLSGLACRPAGCIISGRPAARTHLPTVPSLDTLSNSTVYGYRCSTTLNRLIRLPELLLPTKCCSVPTKWTLRRANCFTLIHKGNNRNSPAVIDGYCVCVSICMYVCIYTCVCVHIYIHSRAWGSVVVKTLHYKSEGPGIDSER